MPMPGQSQRAASKFILFENFKKLNTAELRTGLQEAELAWVENLQPLADNNWATVPGPGGPFVLTQTTNLMFYGVLHGIDYVVVFTTQGSAWAIRLDNGVQTKFAPDGTFSLSPDMTVWQEQYFLFNDVAAGYSAWDGTLFFQTSTVSPVVEILDGGFGYTSPPNVFISGGHGAGAAGQSVISGGSVVGVTITNPGTGYVAGDVLQISFGSGAGNGAAAHVATMSGSGVQGVVIDNGGAYLSPPTVSFSGGGGSGAAGTAILTAGVVTSVQMTNNGSGYTSPPNVAFTAGGITATGHTVLVGQSVSTIAPMDSVGGGYTSPPTVLFSGGGGSGAQATPNMVGLTVGSLTLINGGGAYQTAPTITISSGQGAAARVIIWPIVPKGTSVAVFGGRVWLNFFGKSGQLNGLQWTGVNGIDDFDVANASGALLITDTDLIHQITGLRNFNNFLWIIGDQSIKQIGNISLNAAGNVTLFTILTLSSDQGSKYLPSCVSFNRVFFFINENGVYAVFGSSVQKVSDDLDGIFQMCDFTLVPQATLLDMTNVHNVAWLLRINDTVISATLRTIFVIFNGKRWFLGSQGNSIKAVAGTARLVLHNWVPYISSGTDLAPAFFDTTVTVTFNLLTALSHHGNPVQRKKTIRLGWAMSLAAGTGSVTLRATTDEGGSINLTANLVAGFQTRTVSDPNVSGTYLGFGLSGTLKGYTLSNLRIEYQETNIGNQN